jgi:hypothetical protein
VQILPENLIIHLPIHDHGLKKRALPDNELDHAVDQRQQVPAEERQTQHLAEAPGCLDD